MSKLFPINNGALMLLRPSFPSNSCLRNGTSATLPDFSDLTRLEARSTGPGPGAPTAPEVLQLSSSPPGVRPVGCSLRLATPAEKVVDTIDDDRGGPAGLVSGWQLNHS